jgi:hypothetical protein
LNEKSEIELGYKFGYTVFLMKISIEIDGRPKSEVGREHPT